MVGSCPGEPMEDSEVPWVVCLPKAALARPWMPHHPVPTSVLAVRPSFCSQQMSHSGRLAPGKRECVGTQALGREKLLLIFSLFHSTDACLVRCSVLTAGDTGISGTAKPPALPKHTLSTLPRGLSGVCLGAVRERDKWKGS